jgi:hypothetical protein
MHRLSASGVQRQGALDARAKLAGPAGKEDEERDEKRLSKADRTARPTSSATFSTLSVKMRRTHIEHMLSAYHPIATTERTFRIGWFVPKHKIAAR